jgi:hypothetical protein
MRFGEGPRPADRSLPICSFPYVEVKVDALPSILYRVSDSYQHIFVYASFVTQPAAFEVSQAKSRSALQTSKPAH